MSDIPPTTSNAGIPCDDSQDCPKYMLCRDVDGRKRCQRTIDNAFDIGVIGFIWLGFAGLVGLAILYVVVVVIKVKLEERWEKVKIK